MPSAGRLRCIDIVLVHGTTQSPRGWDLLSDALSNRGHRCQSIDLVGVRSDASSAEFATAAAGQVDATNPIVVAHSGAGLLLGAICRAVDAGHQVFLAAFIPNGHESLVNELQRDAETLFSPEWIGKDPSDVDVAGSFLVHDCDEPTAQWAATTLRLFVPASVYHEVVRVDLATPATVIVPSSDRTMRPAWMARAARDRLGIDPIFVDGGHCPHVSRPEEIAAIIDAIE